MRTKKVSVVWDPDDGFDKKLLYGIKLVFWAIILLAMALAVRKFFLC